MKNTLIKYNENNELIDGKFIKKFNDQYIEENKLSNYYKKTEIDFLSNDIARYKDEIITINMDLFVKKVLNINEYNIFEMNKQIIIKLNELLLKTLYHELIHVQQNKTYTEKTNILEYNLIKNSLEQIKLNYIKYKKYHKLFPVEWEANIISEYLTNDFLKINNNNLDIWYKECYMHGNPLKQYFYYTNQDYNEFLFTNLEEVKKLNEYQKFIHGFKIKNNTILNELNNNY